MPCGAEGSETAASADVQPAAVPVTEVGLGGATGVAFGEAHAHSDMPATITSHLRMRTAGHDALERSGKDQVSTTSVIRTQAT